MRENRVAMGSFENLPDVRLNFVLRQFAEPSRHKALAFERASGNCIGGARRTLVVVLSRRSVRRILSFSADRF